jgi:hypothetical protein
MDRIKQLDEQISLLKDERDKLTNERVKFFEEEYSELLSEIKSKKYYTYEENVAYDEKKVKIFIPTNKVKYSSFNDEFYIIADEMSLTIYDDYFETHTAKNNTELLIKDLSANVRYKILDEKFINEILNPILESVVNQYKNLI